jgi:RHS repeat-associated protein
VVPACTLFFYDSSSRLLAEHDCSAGASPEPALNVVAEYVYLDGYHVLAVRRDGHWYWYVNDHLPTPRKLVDAAGAVVWDGRMEPFGRVDDTGSTVEQPLRFPGQVADAVASVVYNGHRHVAPGVGRFLAADPACCGEPGACCSDSCYAYANNAALRAIDPSGALLEYIGCDDALRLRVEGAIRLEAQRQPDPMCDGARNILALLDSPEETWVVRCVPSLRPSADCPWPGCGTHGATCGGRAREILLSAAAGCRDCLPRTLIHELFEITTHRWEREVWRVARKWAALMALPPHCFLEGP